MEGGRLEPNYTSTSLHYEGGGVRVGRRGEWGVGGGWSDLWSGLRFVFLSRTATALYFEIEFCLEILISSLCIVDLFSLVFSFCVFCF